MTIEDLVAQRTRIERAAKRRQLTGDEFDACQRLSMEIRRLQAEAGTTMPKPNNELTWTRVALPSWK